VKELREFEIDFLEMDRWILNLDRQKRERTFRLQKKKKDALLPKEDKG
jgi:hypothetical protein